MSTHRQHELQAAGQIARVAVLTLSDTRTPDTDTSGQAIRELLVADGHIVAAYALIPDEPDALRATLNRWLVDASIDVILTNGGTGLSSRDTTIDVIEVMITTHLPGFGELFRMLSHREIGSAAMLSRATAGIANGKLIAALPGSTNAVRLAMQELLLPQLRHAIDQLRK